MAEIKYLDLVGLGYYDGKIKSYIDTKVATVATTATEALEQINAYNPNIIIGFDESGAAKGVAGRLGLSFKSGDNTDNDIHVDIPVVATTDADSEIGNKRVGVVSANAAAKWNNAATKADTNETNISALTTKVDGLVTAGGEPNKIEGISINTHTVEIADKIAKLNVNLSYDSGSQKIELTSEISDGDVIVLSSINAADFIKDGMLESAEIIEVPGDEAVTTDRPAGKYIKLSWNTDAGQDPTYIPVADLLTEYTFNAGEEATYGTTNKLGIKLTASTTTLANGTKQTTYTPTISQTGWLTNVDNTLGALNTTYAAKSHTHAISEVTDLQTTLDAIKATADSAVQAADLKRIENTDIDKLFTA